MATEFNLKQIKPGAEGTVPVVQSGVLTWVPLADLGIGGGEPSMTIDDGTDWGTGTDGAVTYSGTSTVTADVHATTIVFQSGCVVSVGWNTSESRPAIFRATTSITVDGSVTASGSAAGASASGVGGAGGASLTGAGGGAGVGTASASGGTSSRPSSDGSGTAGGAVNGGAGGSVSSLHGGGRGGRGATFGGNTTILPGEGGNAPKVVVLSPPATMAELIEYADSGGGGGGGAATSNGVTGNASGGGGGGGGGAFLAAPTITVSGTGSITADGGAGSAGQGTTGGGGPGGGGGGGSVILCARTLTIAGSISATGGAGGTRTVGTTAHGIGERGVEGTIYLASESFPSLSPSAPTTVALIKVAP